MAARGRDADETEGMRRAGLEPLRARAWHLRAPLDRGIHAADGRHAEPPAGGAPVAPLGSDWTHRPEPFARPVPAPGRAGLASGTAVGAEATLFHDCPGPELSLRQFRNGPRTIGAPFGLVLEVFRFDGSFVSLVFDVPHAGVSGLGRRHLVRLAATLETEAPLDAYARLNLRHGPNTAQIVRKLPPDRTDIALDFDLAYSDLDAARVDRMWVDLIFDRPEANRITLGDVTLSRRPRAEL